MYKKIEAEDKTLILSYPANKKTSFYIEGMGYYYTIIDVLSIGESMYAMLENNTLGEEDCPIVYLGKGKCTNATILERYDRKTINVNLTTEASQVIFIRTKQIVVERAYDSIENTLFEEDYYSLATNNVINWTDEDINNESILQGGIIR